MKLREILFEIDQSLTKEIVFSDGTKGKIEVSFREGDYDNNYDFHDHLSATIFGSDGKSLASIGIENCQGMHDHQHQQKILDVLVGKFSRIDKNTIDKDSFYDAVSNIVGDLID